MIWHYQGKNLSSSFEFCFVVDWSYKIQDTQNSYQVLHVEWHSSNYPASGSFSFIVFDFQYLKLVMVIGLSGVQFREYSGE